jgi:myo-inositol-1(or 4)-monophosphatase
MRDLHHKKKTCIAPKLIVTSSLKQVVMDAVDKPRNIQLKGALDLVTDTDKASEDACLAVIREACPEHAILGEEGGVSGDTSSDYLWCIDPLDGTTNFAHGYPSFAVSVGVLRHAMPVAACVVEFVGGALQAQLHRSSIGRNGHKIWCPLSFSRERDFEIYF